MQPTVSTPHLCLQETFAPHNRCYGCGPSNDLGLRLRSFPTDGLVVAHFHPSPHHLAFDGVLNGGIIGTILDCHCNWTAAYHLMLARGLEHPPCTVTANYTIHLRRVTPLNVELFLQARPIHIDSDRVQIQGTLEVDGRVTAECSGLFVAVKEGHPAYHRW